MDMIIRGLLVLVTGITDVRKSLGQSGISVGFCTKLAADGHKWRRKNGPGLKCDFTVRQIGFIFRRASKSVSARQLRK